jgi:hypothetical protein
MFHNTLRFFTREVWVDRSLVSRAILAFGLGSLAIACSDDGQPLDAATPDLGADQRVVIDGSEDSGSGDLRADATSDARSDQSPRDFRPDRPKPDLTPDMIPPPSNATCAKALPVALASVGPTRLSGNTKAADDEHDTLSCGAKLSDGTPRAFDGSQVYFRVTLTAGEWVLRQESAEFEGVFYAFPATANVCQSASNMETACRDRYASDKLSLTVDQASEDWIIAMDSENSVREGAFALLLQQASPIAAADCASPEQLTLQNGALFFSGTTRGAKNALEVACRAGSPLSGGQVYHRVQLEQAKSYKIELNARDDLALYAVAAAIGCDQAAIEKACQSASSDPRQIVFSDHLGTRDETVVVTPATTGDYLIVVDAASKRRFSDYTLRVSELSVLTNTSCSAPQSVDSTTLPKTVFGDTTGVKNDLQGVSCGLGSGVFDGAQLYYELALQAGKTYLVTVKDLTFDAGLYAFAKATACTQTAVDGACRNPQTPDPKNLLVQDRYFGVDRLAPETIRITPTQNESWVVVVDSLVAQERGRFTLEIREHSTPSHQRCSSARAVALSDNPTVVRDDTSLPGTQNELGQSITCAGALSWPLDAAQLYYRVTLSAPHSYTIRLRPSGWDGALLAFPASASCTASGINAGCWGGAAGPYRSDLQGEGLTEQLTITPRGRQDWMIVVDGHQTSGVNTSGPFALELSW